MTLCHSRTPDLAADARGRHPDRGHRPGGLHHRRHIQPGAVVVDFGINVLPDGQIVGDVDFAAAREVAGAITPVPGGTGLVTNALLARNCLIAAQRQRRDEELEHQRRMRRQPGEIS